MNYIIKIKNKIVEAYTSLVFYIKYLTICRQNKNLRLRQKLLQEYTRKEELKDKLIDASQNTKSNDFDTLIKFMRKDKL